MDEKTRKAFVDRFLPVAQQLEQKYGMPAWASLSQWAHETNYGTSPMFLKQNNIAGIGASDAAGKNAMTFSSPEDSADYAVRLQMAKAQRPENQAFAKQRYGASAAILADSKTTPEQAFAAMKDSKWAADPNYNTNLMTRYQQIQPYLGNQAPQVNVKAAMIQPQPNTPNPAQPPGTPSFGTTTMNPVNYPPKPSSPPVNNPPGMIAYKSPTGQKSYIPAPVPQSQPNPGFNVGDVFNAIGRIFKG